MGSCTSRHFLLSICFLQLLLVIERQVFDFLGYMWAPIFVNFFHIIFVIFGIFGAYQLRAKYIITYSVWNVLWIGWNIFLICFYLNIGVLDRNSDILNIGTGSVSWFEINGYGCKPTYPTNITSEDPFRPVRPERVEECFLEYPIVEVIHSGVQCIFALLGLLGAICIGRIFIDEDDDQSSRGGSTSKKSKKYRQSLYSIEFSPQIDTIRGHDNDLLTYHQQSDLRGIVELSPKPMTPRRVKRRSVMTRGTNNRQSTTSRRSGGTSNRNSVRNSRRKVHHQNPVTKIIEQQNSKLYSSGGAVSCIGAVGGYIPSGVQTAMEQHSTLTVSNLKSLNHDYVQTKLTNIPTYHNANTQPDPIYYNMSASSPLIQQSWNASSNSTTGVLNSHNNAMGGHKNPSYQHSTPNLSHSPEPPDEPYHRPPSVRSSYSNFHGARPLTSHTITTPTENVFVQLQQLGHNNSNNHNNHQHNHNNVASTSSSSQAIPQVPSRRPMNPPPPNPNEQPPPNLRTNRMDSSERSLAFINSGPPAYNLNYHTPPDSETTM